MSYQLLRNLWHAAAEDTSSVLLLLPRGNETLCSQLNEFLPLVGKELGSRMKIAYVEDVVNALATSTLSQNPLSWYAAMVRDKYVLV
jgi:restriction endonuclease-like protein